MKVLITESQFDKLIFKYLDNQDFIQIDKSDGVYFVNSEGDEYAQIRYFKKDSKCVIYTGLVGEVSSFFSMQGYDAREAIGRWVGETLKVDIDYCLWANNIKSEWMQIPSN
jgi:hypothetical protein